eukprot:g4254.t1
MYTCIVTLSLLLAASTANPVVGIPTKRTTALITLGSVILGNSKNLFVNADDFTLDEEEIDLLADDTDDFAFDENELENNNDDDNDHLHEDIKQETRTEKLARYQKFENSPETTAMWSLINANDLKGIENSLKYDPDLAQLRSEDGRGPLFWAYEYNAIEIAQYLISKGADDNAKDIHGNTPKDMLGKDERPEPIVYEDDEEEEDAEIEALLGEDGDLDDLDDEEL